MAVTARNPYEEPESSTTKWIILFVLLSVFAHILIVGLIILISGHLPATKLPEPEKQTINLTLLPPSAAPQPKPLFVPTEEQLNAAHKKQMIESANDHDLMTKNQQARNANSLMPDVTGHEHRPDLNDAPKSMAPPKPQVGPTSPTSQQPQPQKPVPPQPKPAPPQPTPPQPPQPAPKPAPPQKQPPKVNDNGLPVLPTINAQTMAEQNPSLMSAAPPISVPAQATSIHGALGAKGDNSPAAMASVFGKYKQKVYRAVGSRWYPKVDNQFQILGVGMVHVQFTIHADGTVETKVLDGGNGTMQILLTISINSIREAAPYEPFDHYPGLREAIIKEQGGDGSSYTDDFTFSVY